MNIKKRSAPVWTVIVLLTLAVLGGAGYALRSVAMPAIKRSRVTRMNAEAREFLTKGDAPNAMLLVRKSLAMAPQNAEAWRIGVTAAKTKNTPEVVTWQDNLCRVEPTKQNYLELIRLALQYPQTYYKALEAIKATAKESSGDPEFHRLAVELYEKQGRPAAAKYHLISLISLVPTDRVVQFKLAAIEMAEDKDRTNRDARSRVRALIDDPALRVQALTLLLREAVTAKLTVDTTELLARLKAIPDLTVDQQLLVIEASILVSPDNVEGLLEGLKSKVADSPVETVRVLEFLRRTGAPQQAWIWYQKLPEKTRLSEIVLRSTGEALFDLKDWKQLDTFARGSNWGEFNYLRQAFIAYADRALGRTVDFSDAWKRAVIEAGSDGHKASDLIARVDGWKWQEEHYDVLWKIFTLIPRYVPAQQDLIGYERAKGHTANLNKIFATMVQQEPNDGTARNNLTYTSLLMDSNLGQATVMADELVRVDPGNPYFATTRALSLYKQGKFQEALEQIQSLGFAARAMPERMLLEAVFLAKAGESEKATDLLGGLVVRNLLPEEQKLREAALADIANTQRAQGNRNRLQGLKRGAESGGWLGLLDPTTQRDATVDMQLADSAYASGDFAGLADMLKKAEWGNYQYLNSALVTYLRRRSDGPEATRNQWSKTLTLADNSLLSLQNLNRLVTQWAWEPERIETLDKLFEKTPKDRIVMSELLKYYRENRRTSNILKVLTAYVASDDRDSDERADLAYYRLIADRNTSDAHVAAKQAYGLEPDNMKRGLVEVFSLWKQNRSAEAATLLKSLSKNVVVENIPRPLIAAAVEAETEAPQTARASLNAFDSKNALPEEAALAEQINQRIAAREKAGAK